MKEEPAMAASEPSTGALQTDSRERGVSIVYVSSAGK